MCLRVLRCRNHIREKRESESTQKVYRERKTINCITSLTPHATYDVTRKGFYKTRTYSHKRIPRVLFTSLLFIMSVTKTKGESREKTRRARENTYVGGQKVTRIDGKIDTAVLIQIIFQSVQ